MIVDDDEDDRELFCEAVSLISDDLKCVDAHDGEYALQYLRDQERVMPRFIFLDLNMPRLNGAQCLAEIKKIEHLKEIPVIIYSTSNHQLDKQQTKELGASGFVHKHTDFQMLCAELKKWLA